MSLKCQLKKRRSDQFDWALHLNCSHNFEFGNCTLDCIPSKRKQRCSFDNWERERRRWSSLNRTDVHRRDSHRRERASKRNFHVLCWLNEKKKNWTSNKCHICPFENATSSPCEGSRIAWCSVRSLTHLMITLFPLWRRKAHKEKVSICETEAY